MIRKHVSWDALLIKLTEIRNKMFSAKLNKKTGTAIEYSEEKTW